MTLVTFGQYITIKREAMKLNRSETSRRLNVSETSLKNWESDLSVPSTTSLEVLKQFYRMKDEELEPYNLARGKFGNRSISSKISISSILTDIKALMNNIEEIMTGSSQFEINIKNKSMNRLTQAMDMLKPIAIIDEGL